MGFRFQRRINLGKGLGLNLSKSGLSLSKRTSWGSFGTKGFSIRTGIPGLSFRSGRRSGGGLVALLVGLVYLGFQGLVVALYVGVWLARLSVIAAYWLFVGLFQVGRWLVLTCYDLAAYASSRRLPTGDLTLDTFEASLRGISPTSTTYDETSPQLQALNDTAQAGAGVSDASQHEGSSPGEAVAVEAEYGRLRARLEAARGPAARRTVVERAVRTLSPALRDRFLLEASQVEVQAAIAKASGFKSTNAKRRVLTEALTQVRGDNIPDELQVMQIRWLEDALRALED